jgi:hypothetical protein
MPTNPKPQENNSAVSVLTELAVEGTSSLVEAHRALLDLAQQENNLVLKGLKRQVSGFAPAAAMADFARRSLDTFIQLQQELLTSTSKQTVQWLEPSSAENPDRGAQLLDFAREGVESFARAQKKFLDAVSEESAKAMSGEQESEIGKADLTDLKQLACDAGNAFLEAQSRLLDIMNQQMNVNVNAANRTAEMISPSQFTPIATLARDSVKSFFDGETALVGSLTKGRQAEKVRSKKKRVSRAPRRREPAAV